MKFELQHGAPVLPRHTGSYLFVISHMRSFSSLLCHILGSHPEISGYAESHQSYSVRSDLLRLVRKVHEQTGEAALGRYVLDKILHDNMEIAPGILCRPDVKCVFLLRNPDDALRSVLSLMRAVGRAEMYSDEQVLRYYIDRLKAMEQYSALLGDKAYFVEAERVVGESGALLGELTRWLGLATPLSAEYATFRLTGLNGYGDSSPNIKAGRIVSDDERRRDAPDIAIPEEALRRAREAYNACREALMLQCRIPGRVPRLSQ